MRHLAKRRKKLRSIWKKAMRRSNEIKQIREALASNVVCPDCTAPLGVLGELFAASGTKLERIHKSKVWFSVYCPKCRRRVTLLTKKAYWREINPEWKEAEERWNSRPNVDAMRYRVPGSTRQ